MAAASFADFPIARRWPPKRLDVIQLYSLPTPNGVKASIALEELGLSYDAHRVSFDANHQLTPEFLALNPNGKIPAIVDPNGPNGEPLALWESGAILLYLAEKAGRLMPADPALRWQAVQWLMFQMSAVGPMFGQVGFFHHFSGKEIEDKRPLKRYANESRRILGVLDRRLDGRAWIMGEEYTLVDIATFPWIRNLVFHYKAGNLVGYDDFGNVKRVLDAFLARPAVVRGLRIPAAEQAP
jgi:GST-like protein